MGWLFLNECPPRSDLVAHLRRPGRFGDGEQFRLKAAQLARAEVLPC